MQAATQAVLAVYWPGVKMKTQEERRAPQTGDTASRRLLGYCAISFLLFSSVSQEISVKYTVHQESHVCRCPLRPEVSADVLSGLFTAASTL